MKVLFLDVDGVLNASERVVKGDPGFFLPDWVIPKCMEHVNRIINETGARVVFTSTWRCDKTIPECRTMLEEVGLVKDSFFSCTPELDTCGATTVQACEREHRGREILDWLRNYQAVYGQPIEAWCVLDDDDGAGVEPVRDHLVLTDSFRGVTRRKREQAIKMLGRNKTA
jgi:hypothetical protein